MYKLVKKRTTFPFEVVARERELNMTLLYYNSHTNDNGVKLEATYEVIGVIPNPGTPPPGPDNSPDDEEDESKPFLGLNIPTVVGISTCIIIIIIAICLILYRKLLSTPKNKDIADSSDVDENCASLSGSSIRQGVDSSTGKESSRSDTPQKPTSLNLDKKFTNGLAPPGETQRLMGNQQNLFVRVNPTQGMSPMSPMYPNGLHVPMGQMGPQMGQLPHMGQFGQLAFSPISPYPPDGGHVLTPEGHVAFLPTSVNFGTQGAMVNTQANMLGYPSH